MLLGKAGFSLPRERAFSRALPLLTWKKLFESSTAFFALDRQFSAVIVTSATFIVRRTVLASNAGNPVRGLVRSTRVHFKDD